jgi:hypothetical protein
MVNVPSLPHFPSTISAVNAVQKPSGRRRRRFGFDMNRAIKRAPLALTALIAWFAGALLFITAVTAFSSRHWLLSLAFLFFTLVVASVGIWISEYLWTTIRRRNRLRALRRLGLIRS